MDATQLLTVSEAARALGVSASTVRNWIRQDRLLAQQGDQPVRPRWWVIANPRGEPLGADGEPYETAGHSTTGQVRISGIERRLERLERGSSEGQSSERYRDAALQLSVAMEHQRRAFQLQLEAAKELEQAVAEQAAIISGLLIGDPTSELT